MDKKGAIEYISHSDWRESRLGLERINELLARLGNPHHELQYVHVAGTNGKGSVCAMLASVLTCAGYKTGLYTSPYINHFNERIQIDGKPISDDDLVAVTMSVKNEAEKLLDPPTEFELITTIAFEHFRRSNCDIVVLEVGLGGRLDATNVIKRPELAVITPISFDHMDVLGDTISKIAAEKAGIIKPGGRIISSPQLPQAAEVIERVCSEQNAKLEFVDLKGLLVLQNEISGQRFSFGRYADIEISLLGEAQRANAALTISIVESLRSANFEISDEALLSGLAKTRWPARFEIVKREPWVIVDGGHNVQSLDVLADNLNTYFGGKKISFVIGAMADKDIKTMFRNLIPLSKTVFTVTPDNPRALAAEDLASFFSACGIKNTEACKSIEQGITKAIDKAEKDDVICACGSFYMAGAIRKILGVNE